MLCGSTVVDHGDCCSNQQRRLSDDFRFVVGRRLLLLSFSIFQFVVSLYYLLYKYREGEKVMKRRKEEGEKVKREKKKRRTRRNRKKLEREEVVQEEEEDQVNQNEHKTT